MKKIIAIGGGEIAKKETLLIDKEIIRLSGKKHPTLLFIPTASSDAQDYWQWVQKYFGKQLGCKTEVLWLLKEHPSKQHIEKKMLSADIIYVGGGNTLKMMRRWRSLGIDKMLYHAWQKGIVLTGISAGSICWFESGHSDSMSFYNEKKWQYINVNGLGFIKGIHCPHYDSETLGVKRKKNFEAMIKKIGGFGIALDDGCALECIDDTYRILTSKKNAQGYKVYKKNGKVVSEVIEIKKELRPLTELYKRIP